MSRSRAKFTQSDIARILKASQQSGCPVRVEITADKITVISGGKPSESTNGAEMNPWDEVMTHDADKNRTT
jgi:hypothetical protein